MNYIQKKTKKQEHNKNFPSITFSLNFQNSVSNYIILTIQADEKNSKKTHMQVLNIVGSYVCEIGYTLSKSILQRGCYE